MLWDPTGEGLMGRLSSEINEGVTLAATRETRRSTVAPCFVWPKWVNTGVHARRAFIGRER